MVLALPRLLGTAWASAGRQSRPARPGLGRRRRARVVAAARWLAMVAVAFPILATAVDPGPAARAGRRLTLGGAPAGGPSAAALAGLLAAGAGRRPGLPVVAAARALPADPALRGRHADRRPSPRRARRRAGAACAPGLRPDHHRLARRRRRARPRRARSSRSCWSRATGRAGARDRRRRRRRRRGSATATAPGSRGSSRSTSPLRARRGRQPGDGGQHHATAPSSTTWPSRWSGSTTTPRR